MYVNPGVCWSFRGCSFEGLAGNGTTTKANGIRVAPGYQPASVSIESCWFGDAGAPVGYDGGAWISGAFAGLSVKGCQFQAQTATVTAFAFAAATQGCAINGNVFSGLKAAFDFGTHASYQMDCLGNTYASCLAIIAAGTEPITGRVDSTASPSIFDGSDQTHYTRLKTRIDSGAQSIPDSTLTTLNNFTVAYDPNSSITAPGVYTCRQAGIYQINAFVELVMTGGYLEAYVYVGSNPVGRATRGSVVTGGGTASSISADQFQLNVGDLVTLRVYQTSGATATIYLASLSVHYLSS